MWQIIVYIMIFHKIVQFKWNQDKYLNNQMKWELKKVSIH